MIRARQDVGSCWHPDPIVPSPLLTTNDWADGYNDEVLQLGRSLFLEYEEYLI